METWHERLKKRRKSLNLTQADVYRKIGVSNYTVSSWEFGKHKPEGENLMALCRVLHCDPDWLMTGRGSPSGRARIRWPGLSEEPSVYNTEPGPPIHTRVPLISWTTAGHWADVMDSFTTGDAEDWIPTTATVGPHAFALRIRGDSMAPTVPDGAIVIVDPDIQYRHRSIVIVRQNHGNESTCKRAIQEGSRWYLAPDNPRYPVMELAPDAEVVGVVRQVIIDID